MFKKWTARNKMMDLLARRDHSEQELRSKLLEKFPTEEVESAIEFAKERSWLGDEQKIAEQFARSLHKKRKGLTYINHFLKKKGLPGVTKTEDLEIDKARSLMASKTKGLTSLTRAQKAKYSRFLAARGFDPHTIRVALSDFRIQDIDLENSNDDSE